MYLWMLAAVVAYFIKGLCGFANTLVFPFSNKGDVRVYSQKELRLFFESAGFTGFESYITDTVLFLSAEK